MKFIIGIGNPEKRYAGTRHNAGFAVVDTLAAQAPWQLRGALSAQMCRLREGVYLVKPDTYVNRTGVAAAALWKKYRPLHADMLFVVDDANLDFGKLRLRASGSAGGHHGLESAIEQLGSEDFPRLRVGIRRREMPQELPDFVLGKWKADETERLPVLLANAASVCDAWAREGLDAAQNRLSRLQGLADNAGA